MNTEIQIHKYKYKTASLNSSVKSSFRYSKSLQHHQCNLKCKCKSQNPHSKEKLKPSDPNIFTWRSALTSLDVPTANTILDREIMKHGDRVDTNLDEKIDKILSIYTSATSLCEGRGNSRIRCKWGARFLWDNTIGSFSETFSWSHLNQWYSIFIGNCFAVRLIFPPSFEFEIKIRKRDGILWEHMLKTDNSDVRRFTGSDRSQMSTNRNSFFVNKRSRAESTSSTTLRSSHQNKSSPFIFALMWRRR